MKSSVKKQTNPKGIILQYNTKVEGVPDHCLSFSKCPLILRPMRRFRHDLVRNRDAGRAHFETPDFHFKDVKFACSSLRNLIILQNQSEHLSILFENCFFVNEK